MNRRRFWKTQIILFMGFRMLFSPTHSYAESNDGGIEAYYEAHSTAADPESNYPRAAIPIHQEYAYNDADSEEADAYDASPENNEDQNSGSTPSKFARLKYNPDDFTARIPSQVAPTGSKVIIVDPRVHAWGAYGADGRLVRGGVATAGRGFCPDTGQPCHTKTGIFHIYSLGSSSCVSTKFPVGQGGAPMPYCMFFNNGQALHGSYEVADANLSHGCVRLKVEDAEWIRYNFADIGTTVIIKPY